MKRRQFLRKTALYAAGAAILPAARAASATGSAARQPGPPATPNSELRTLNSGDVPAALFNAYPNTGYKRAFSSRSALIWHPNDRAYFDTPRNEWVYFRKTLDLAAAPSAAELRIFADSRYRLFVNGEYIARGPARSDPRFQAFDIIDLAKNLRAGKNLIAVQVLYYGYNTGQYIARIPCLLAELDITGAAGKKRTHRTDASWKTFLSKSFDPDAPRVNGCQGAIEIFDARLDPAGWTQPGFDDTAWPAAKPRTIGNEQIPYNRLLPRDIPMMEETILPAARISAPQTVPAHDEEHFLPQRARLELDQLRKAEFSIFDDDVASLGTRFSITRSRTETERSGSSPIENRKSKIENSLPALPPPPPGQVTIITFDFARITPGYLRLSATAPAGTRIDIAYAEDLFEGRCTLFNPPAQRPLDSFILAEGRNDLEIAFAWKGFRYAQLIIRTPQTPNPELRTPNTELITIHSAALRTRTLAVKHTGRVRTPDAFQQNLHAICAHSLRGCMQDGFIDSPSREQQQWMGDGRWQAIYNYYLSGDPRLHRRLLYQIACSQDAEGLTKSRYPDGHENWSPIPSYCLAWVTSFDDYHRFTGDLSPAADLWPNIIMALRWFTRYENKNGLLENVPFWPYIDLGGYPEKPGLDINRGGILTALNLLYLESLRAGATLAAALNDDAARAAFTARADALDNAISTHLWDDSRGAYPDCSVDGKLSDTISEPTNALALLHLHPGNAGRQLGPSASATPNSEPRTPNSAARAARILKHFGRASTVISSPYSMPLVIRALLRNNRATLAWQLIRERYQPIIDAGLGTTWEYWKVFFPVPSGRVHAHSASHAWGAGPLVLFFEGIAGLQITAPALRRFTLAPQLPENLDEAEFVIPTPSGNIEGRVRRVSNKQIQLAFTVPPGSTATVSGREYSAGAHTTTIPA